MKINMLIAGGALLALTGCLPYAPLGTPVAPPLQPVEQPQLGPDGLPLPSVYRITAEETYVIPQRVTDQVNILRANLSLQPLALSPQLSAAALAHARDMSAQNRAWHWGSDGSSPIDRARRNGYSGRIIGENISESYETDMQTLNAWMGTRETRDVIMDASASSLGIAWYQEPTGKIWWTLLIGG